MENLINYKFQQFMNVDQVNIVVFADKHFFQQQLNLYFADFQVLEQRFVLWRFVE